MTEQLKALAEAAKGWNTNHAMPEIDGEPIDVGQLLDGEFYPIITVDCGQYDQTSKHLAEYICYATPQRILALIAENERLQLWANRFKALRDMECAMCPPDKLSYYINNYDELDKHIARVNVASSELGETK